jgi:hypothetical protein
MTKNQKILLWVSIALFIVPEVIWSPVINFYHDLFNTNKIGGTTIFRNSFLQSPDNLDLLKLVLLIELIGTVSALIIIFKNRHSISNLVRGWVLVILMVLLVVIFGFALYFIYSFNPDIL